MELLRERVGVLSLLFRSKYIYMHLLDIRVVCTWDLSESETDYYKSPRRITRIRRKYAQAGAEATADSTMYTYTRTAACIS